MKIYTDEFSNAVLNVLQSNLKPIKSSAFTREQVAYELGMPLDPKSLAAITGLLDTEAFNGYESVKSRGIRIKLGVATVAPPVTETPAEPVEAPVEETVVLDAE